MLLEANHKNKQCGSIYVKRGQLLTSKLKLSRSWRWSEWKVRTFLKILENLRQISVKTTTQYTVITICNYNGYQPQPKKNREQNGKKPRTNREQTATTNNDNNENKKKGVEYFGFWE